MEPSLQAAVTAYFIERLLIAIAFLLPLIVSYRLEKRARCPAEASALKKISLGFAVGFSFYLVGGFAAAYIYGLPVLPVLLHERGIPLDKAAAIATLYHIAFTAIYLVALYTSLLLVAYGVYKLVTERC